MKSRGFAMLAIAAVVSMLSLASCGSKKHIPPPTSRGTAPTQGTVAPVPEEQPLVQAEEAYEFVDVNFDFDRYNLTEASQRTLTQHAKTLLERTGAAVRIEGHCDERGTVEYNLALGEKRAKAVKNFLVQYGVPAENITTISYGKERPKDARRNEAGWAINRRAEFHLIR